MKVCVYAGSGAVLAKDVEFALEKLEIPCDRISEFDVKEGNLEGCSVLIVPGGYTAGIVGGLGKEGLESIRDSVRRGGGYIGICAGAYIAAQTVEVGGRPPGLGIINIQNRRESGKSIRVVEITNPGHPIAKDCRDTLEIWYQNGPMIGPGKGVETVAVYENGSAAIVCSAYGKGKVIIFSPHPEGSLENRVDPEQLGTLKLLGNAVSFALKLKKPNTK